MESVAVASDLIQLLSLPGVARGADGDGIAGATGIETDRADKLNTNSTPETAANDSDEVVEAFSKLLADEAMEKLNSTLVREMKDKLQTISESELPSSDTEKEPTGEDHYNLEAFVQSQASFIDAFNTAASTADACGLIRAFELDLFSCSLSYFPDLAIEKDTAHQDKRDIERDNIILNGVLFSGSELKYRGMIEAFHQALDDLIPSVFKPESQPIPAARYNSALNRFSRVIVHLGNRTNSGGAALELIVKLFGGSELLTIVPSSGKAAPIAVNLKVGRVEDQHGSDFGILAEVSASTFFSLVDASDLSPCSEVSTTFRQTLFLPLPLLSFPCQQNVDDTRCDRNQVDYVDLPVTVRNRVLQYAVDLSVDS